MGAAGLRRFREFGERGHVAGKESESRSSTKLWICVLEAEVHTRVDGDGDAFDALDRADELLVKVDLVDGPRPVLGHFDESSLMGERGITAVRLRRSTEARARTRSRPGQHGRLPQDTIPPAHQRGQGPPPAQADRPSLPRRHPVTRHRPSNGQRGRRQRRPRATSRLRTPRVNRRRTPTRRGPGRPPVGSDPRWT